MASVKVYFLTLSLIAFAIASGSAAISSRIKNGTPADTIERFPWHVSIHAPGKPINCSGTIINKRWVLTAQSCVKDNHLYELSFSRLYQDSFNGSFSLTVDRTAIVDYPTQYAYDNLAMIKLPISLEISKVVALAKFTAVNLVDNSLMVMAGFGNQTNELTFGMFRLLSAKECKAAYGTRYNEYLQLCTESWDYTNQVPCLNNEGGGLFVNWPTNPTLVGIFVNGDSNCNGKLPAIYTKLLTYLDWINDVIRYQ